MSTTITGVVTNGVVIPSSPLPEGAKVEVIVPVAEQSSRPAVNATRETVRAAALDQLLALARSSSFRSAGAYPTRDELHERH
ncbi:MAG: hypothetical protein U0793_14330 [Gemmataceae bacterium]